MNDKKSSAKIATFWNNHKCLKAKTRPKESETDFYKKVRLFYC